MMQQSVEQMAAGHCRACEGDVKKYSAAEAAEQAARLPEWRLNPAADRIRRDWQVKDFWAAIRFFTQVADVAEAEGHHPDLHLENDRHVWIELWTHVVGGLSENDFILAAKIDRLAHVL
jgi:4a-hydroxytetrahydrobiopterin dehydratase